MSDRSRAAPRLHCDSGILLDRKIAHVAKEKIPHQQVLPVKRAPPIHESASMHRTSTNRKSSLRIQSRFGSFVSSSALSLALGLLALGTACSDDSGGSDDSSSTGGTSSGGAPGSGGDASGAGGADPGTGGAATGGAGTGGASACADPVAAGEPLAAGTLGDRYACLFPLGVALSTAHLNNEQARTVASTHFNHFTAENSMKADSIQPSEGNFSWTQADQLADFARARGQKITFHTLVWHRQTPSWFFSGLTAGNSDSIETLKDRLRLHIEAVVNRYADVVSNWDVVNEAVETNGYRTNSPWYEYFGGIDYAYWAFHYTREALETKEPGSSAGKLYYNDFNVNQKVTGILELAAELDARGVRIDGIGDQAHYRVDWPSVDNDLRPTFQAIVDAGYKLKISELDINVYNDYPPPDYTLVPAEEVPFGDEIDQLVATRYGELFALFREFSDHITSVTFWGLNDDASWLNNEPVQNRKNYPLLWDASFQPKAAFDAVLAP